VSAVAVDLSEADRMLAYLRRMPAERWVHLDQIRSDFPTVKFPATTLLGIVGRGLAERKSEAGELYYRAVRQGRSGVRS
jgi:hypothetical protein